MPSNQTRILVIDSDLEVCGIIQAEFEGDRYRVEVAHDSATGLRLAETRRPSFVLLELGPATPEGLDALRRLKEIDPELAVIVLSNDASPEVVVEALQYGAEDFLSKPFDPALIEISMRNIGEKRSLRDQVTRLKSELERDHAFGMLVGETSQMVTLRECIEQVADSDLNILIRGESGTGKDVTARLVHQFSSRREGPFVKVNCAALPENLIESELFGYEKGAFTGAVRAKPGRFQLAHGGTIFLDEITEIPFALQSKLLQVLEQREFVSVGGTRTIRVDCRCIAATNANIDAWMGQQRFREDLFFRLNEFSIFLPPLRERKDDIPLLIDYFLSLYSDRYQRKRRDLSRGAVLQMMEYPWPGNVRELESLLKRVIVLDSEDVIYQTIGGQRGSIQAPNGIAAGSPSAVLGQLSAGAPFPGLKSQWGERVAPSAPTSISEGGLKAIVDRAVETAEREAIVETLNRTKWNRRKAAKQLGISYSSLLRRIARYDLESR
ncbi:MAG: sigma-54-dependent Fis family transcriptional regulator [Candidatus Omnitrophica bacterium]|nr:Regulatory protein AtoC [bacterium]NUN95058.1 sigma-54-dependent Fis family transcriptional regulator [Candidatus Omnitrophota bacterium]